MSNSPTPRAATSTPSKRPGQRPWQLPIRGRGETELLPATKAAIGNKSAELVWMQIQAEYNQMLLEEPATLQKLVAKVGSELLADDVLPDLEHRRYTPESMLNVIVSSNPTLRLRNVPRLPRLQVVQALLNSLTI